VTWPQYRSAGLRSPHRHLWGPRDVRTSSRRPLACVPHLPEWDADRGHKGQSVCVDALWNVVVEYRHDGKVEIRSQSPNSRGRAVGLCPCAPQIFGVATESREGLVATVSAGVASARLSLDDGNTIDCPLWSIDGTDARYLAIPLPPGVQVAALTAYDELDRELGRFDHETQRQAMEATLGPDSLLRHLR
jgi:hypothetical protein